MTASLELSQAKVELGLSELAGVTNQMATVWLREDAGPDGSPAPGK